MREEVRKKKKKIGATPLPAPGGGGGSRRANASPKEKRRNENAFASRLFVFQSADISASMAIEVKKFGSPRRKRDAKACIADASSAQK